MAHSVPDVSASTTSLSFLKAPDEDAARAHAVIDAMRECGLVLMPWRGPRNEPYYLVMDGPDDDRSGGFDRFMTLPECRMKRELPQGLVHKLLCDELGLDPNDPFLCDKVNAIYDKREQVAS